MSSKHQFAIYVPQLTRFDPQALHHRVARVLRLTPGAQLILFDRQQQVLTELVAVTKHQIELRWLAQPVANQGLAPAITVGLPLLKREALGEALYSCVELGANQVQLLITDKSEGVGVKYGTSGLARLEQIMIAAAEQSKNFSLPELLAPIALTQFLATKRIELLCSCNFVPLVPSTPAGLRRAGPSEVERCCGKNVNYERTLTNNKTGEPVAITLQNHPSLKICFDQFGVPVSELVSKMQVAEQLCLLWGPEGDLTVAEKQQVAAAGFSAVKLTPTVLRASQAVAVGLGLVRSLVSTSHGECPMKL